MTAPMKNRPAQATGGPPATPALERFKAEGLQAFDNAPGFPPFTGAPGSVTNNGHDSATGAGLRIGYQGRVSDMISVGASYSTKISMSKFKKYKGLFAQGGDFDIPASYSLGIALMPTPQWTLAADYSHIAYSDVAAVGNPSRAQAPLGAENGPGFGWQDVKVIKLGVAYALNADLTLRAGYNRGTNPVQSQDVTFNILAPGVVRDHFTAGFTFASSKTSEWTGTFMMARRNTVSGSSLFNDVIGAGAAGTETVRMRQMSLGLGWGYKF